MKSELCQKYFEDTVKPKHLKEFSCKTPEGNEISGYICMKANRFLGSLVITHITQNNGKSYDSEQFVRSFPKIHYWDKDCRLNENKESITYHCLEKLDGTCLIVYPLKDDAGKCIEIVPKTRSLAVCDDHILEMYNLLDKKPIHEFFKQNMYADDILMFELYGILNRHEIAYMDTYIDIRLIGAYIDGVFLNGSSIQTCYRLEDFRKPDIIYSIFKNADENTFSVQWWGHETNLRNYAKFSGDAFPTLYDAISEIKFLLKAINDEYVKYNGRRIIEGVVINGEDSTGEQMYLKIKPHDVEMEKDLFYSVPRRFVLKEVQKYFDEYGSQVSEIYRSDESHHVKYVSRKLAEEFSYEQIQDPRTQKRIRNVFMDVWDSRIPPMSIQNICEELIFQNPGRSAAELMKIFAQKYPSKKRQSRFVFNILAKML